jgi:glutaredoxin
MPGHRFIVYTRQDCPLCDDFAAELSAIAPGFEMRDVDEDPTARRRFGLKVPVLTCDGSVVCHGRLDREAVLRLVSRDTTPPQR